MSNKNQPQHLDQRDDFTGPAGKDDYPERPKHVPIEKKQSHRTRGSEQ